MTDFSISVPVAIFTGAALVLVWFIAKVMAAFRRCRSGKLLATAEHPCCDAAFVEGLARMDRHLAGLLAAVTRPR